MSVAVFLVVVVAIVTVQAVAVAASNNMIDILVFIISIIFTIIAIPI